MGDLSQVNSSQYVSLVDETTGLTANIELVDGQNSLRTFGIQAIESLRGFDPQCDVWFYIGTELDSSGAGNIGDTVRVQIAASTDNPTDYPAVDLTYTLVASDVGDEEELSLNIANYLNSQASFNTLWRAQRIQGNGVVYITSRKPGGQYERPNVDDFIVTSTGTTVVTRAFDKIIRRNKITGLARDPVDPRQGQLGIQGSVVQTAGDVTSRFQTVFTDIAVDGSSTPVEFTENADATQVKFISSVTIAGRDNGIQFSDFLGINGALTNGVEVEFKSNDVMVIREPIRTTDDLLDFHAETPANFVIFFASGEDKVTAQLVFSPALEIRPQGEFSTDDYLLIRINDNLTQINELRAIVSGFNREF